jgi:hypothetical protein
MNIFYWTEAINCEELLYHSLISFDKFHQNKFVNVYIFEEKHLSKIKKKLKNNHFNFIKVSKNNVKLFENSHEGTAYLWSNILQQNYEKFIHFDSDTFFKGNIFDYIEKKLTVYDLVGPLRNYKTNHMNDTSFSNYPNAIATSIFGIKKQKISKYFFSSSPFAIFRRFICYNTTSKVIFLKKCILGYFSPCFKKVIDFFDMVTFDVIKNKGKVFILNFSLVGAVNSKMSRKNKYYKLNDMEGKFKIDYGSKFVHFSSVGSGINFIKNKNNLSRTIPTSYIEYAIDRFHLYNYLLNKKKPPKKYSYIKRFKTLRPYFKY